MLRTLMVLLVSLLAAASAGAQQIAPPGTPEAITEQINRDVNEALAAPELQAKLASLGIDPAGGTREDLSEFMRQERRRWEKVVRAANIPIE